jgi:hypothetical protein
MQASSIQYDLVQPGSKFSVPPKSTDFPEKLNENILGQIVGVKGVL